MSQQSRVATARPARRLLVALTAVVAAVATAIPLAGGPAYAAETVVDVTTFGADKTGATDSTQDVEDAIAHAKTLTAPVRLYFPKGTYELYPDAADQRELYLSNTEGANQTHRFKKYALLLEDVEDFTVDGGGSTLRTHGFMGIFAVIRSERVTIKNFISDHAAPKVVDVSVSAVAAGQRTLSIPTGNPYSISGTTLTFMSDKSPVTGNRYWQNTTSQMWYAQIYDAANQKTWRGSNPLFQNVSSMTDLGGGKIRVNYTTTTTTPTDKGLVYQMRETTRDNAAGVIWESTDTTVTGLTARYLHGFGILGQLSTNVTITGNTFKTDPASGRSTAAFADMIQMSGIKGLVTINDNVFDGAHDDPINIHGTYLEVTGVSGSKLSLKYMHNQTAGFPQYHVGDTIEIVNKSTMATLTGGTATVTAVDGPTGVDSSKPLTTMTITLDKAVPAAVTASNYVVENTTYTPAVQIARNVFRNIPTRGILLTTRGATVIEDNVFDGMSMASIYISSDAASWFESGPVRDVIIRRNTFLRPASPVIFFDPTNATVNKATPVHSGITIENNDFYINSQRLVQTKSVSALTFKNNRVMRDDRERVFALAGLTSRCTAVGSKPKLSVTTSGTAHGTSLFSFSGSAALRIEGNSYDNGLNLRADTSNTTVASDVTVVTDPVLVNTSNTKALLGTVTYSSSNTAVATVASDGTVTAVAAGKTTLTATVQATGRTMSTQPLDLVVGGTATSDDCALTPSWTVKRENASRWSKSADGGLTLNTPGGGTLWGTSNSAPNVFLTSTGTGSGTATVKMSGRTGAGYEEAGLALYEGDGDYVLLQRKHNNGNPSITVVTEFGGVAEESRKISPDPTQTDVWLRLARAGTTVIASYSLDGITFTPIGSPITLKGLNAAKFGLLAAAASGSTTYRPFTFHDFTVNGTAVPFTVVAEARPITGFAGKCVDANGNSSADGTKVQLWDCNGGPSQQWTAVGATLRINGKCLDVTGHGTADGTLMTLWTCTGGANQQWTATAGQLVGAESGKCLDDPGSSTVNGTQLVIWTCHGGANQQWQH